VPEAAEVLGVTVDAVRGRIRRGTLDSERESGTVYVWVERAESYRPRPSAPVRGPSPDQSELVGELRGRVEDLREQLQAERQAHAEARRIIAGLVERIPQLEAPREAPEAAETVEEAPEGAGSRSEAGEAREELVAERALREMAEATLHEGMAEERGRREEAERERDDLRRQLHARSRQREVHEAAEEQQGRGQPRSAASGAQEPSEPFGGRGSSTTRGSWWRRMFRG
jgi:type IV secretory pathway VirB10-like protein